MSELRVERKENMAGGKGHVIIKHILEDKELNGKCKMYAEVTLEPGCSLGYHEHHNESETYYILRGEGNYDDNGRIRPVKGRRYDIYTGWNGTRTDEYRGYRSCIYGADHFGLMHGIF